MDEKTIQDRGENFRTADGRLYLVRCYAPEHGKGGQENYSMAVAAGVCAFCGWSEEKQ